MANTIIYNTTNKLATVAGQIADNDPYQQLSLADRFNSVLAGYSDFNKYIAQDYSVGGRMLYGSIDGEHYRVTLDNYDLTYTGTFSSTFSRVSEVSVRYIPDGSNKTLKGDITYNGLPFFTAENLSSTISSLGASGVGFSVNLSMNAKFSGSFDIVGTIQSVDSGLFSADFQSGKTSTFYSESLSGNIRFQIAGIYSDSINSRITGGYLDSLSLGLYDGKAGVFTDSVLSKNADISLTKPSSDSLDTSSNDVITLTGSLGSLVDAGGGDDAVYGSRGNDTVRLGVGNDFFNGGDGIDTAVFGGIRSASVVTRSETTITVSGFDGRDTLTNVERLKFADTSVALDINGNAGQAYRIYKAALDRVPDLKGLGDWIYALDTGINTLKQVAQGFINSPEFQTKYGANSSNQTFITLLYNNVLDRNPDPGGFADWQRALDIGYSRSDLLIGFSESPENQANVIGLIGNGIQYQNYLLG